MAKEIDPTAPCEVHGCGNLQNTLAEDYAGNVRRVCSDHGETELFGRDPEYRVLCANCGCHIGVN